MAENFRTGCRFLHFPFVVLTERDFNRRKLKYIKQMQKKEKDHMKFLCIYKPAKPEGTPPNQKEMEEMGKLIEEGMKSGWLLSTEGCLPSALGARVRLSKGKITDTAGTLPDYKTNN